MNIKRSKVMFNDHKPNHAIKAEDEVIEYVQECIYLGQKIMTKY